jgi:inner membrane protein
MNPITHLLASWTLADGAGRIFDRDRKIVTWAGVAPDIDGLPILVDGFNALVFHRSSDWYTRFHHSVAHGLPAALITCAVASVLAKNKAKTALFSLLSFHLHLLCDLLGSRGPDPDDIWPISYLAPFSSRRTVSWSGQWALNAWPNVAFTLALLTIIFYRAHKVGYSPVGLFSKKADEEFVSALRNRFSGSLR